jgi:hypothetical protein
MKYRVRAVSLRCRALSPGIRGAERGCNLGTTKSGGVVLQEHALEFLFFMNTLKEAENTIPKGVGNLLVHIIGTDVDQLHEIVLQLETRVDNVERNLDSGRSSSYLV